MGTSVSTPQAVATVIAVEGQTFARDPAGQMRPLMAGDVQIASGLSSARRILALINAESALDENAAGYSSALQGAIEFEHVTFAYRA